uniref:Cobyrinic acid ac-diamide synthase n=1 Tax=Cyanothece sp. (strain PCC 7425 / ATCC 29141) TaxID=395961 RepID=B8HQG6_CYAP4
MAKIISTHSYRGGTGKSNTTANMAAAIASAGYRVGIVDTDIQSPGIHVLLGFNQERIGRSLNDYLWGQCAITDSVYDVSAILGSTSAGSALYLIPSSAKLADISRVVRERYDVELLHDGFKEVIKSLKLDYLFIDTHPGLSEETLLSLTLSDTVILVLRPDQQDFQGTAVTVDVARRLKVPNLLLLVNKALPEYDFEEMRRELTTTYNTPVAGILPLSAEMIRLASKGIFCLQYPDHPLSQMYRQVAQQILVS